MAREPYVPDYSNIVVHKPLGQNTRGLRTNFLPDTPTAPTAPALPRPAAAIRDPLMLAQAQQESRDIDGEDDGLTLPPLDSDFITR